MRSFRIVALCVGLAIAYGVGSPALAQAPAPTREAEIEQEQAEKVKTLHPYVISTGERVMNKVEDITVNGGLHWHPFFDSAYHGAGFTLGAGYMHHVSPYNLLDVRGSYSILGYSRVEAEFIAPRLFQRRGELSILGGYREATQVAFYGFGIDSSVNNRTNYLFKEPYVSGLMTLWPTRRFFMLRGGVEMSQWTQNPGEGSFPSVETVYTPGTLPGLGAKIKYLHSQGTVGFDTRPSHGDYARRGGVYQVTVHDYKDSDEAFGFRQFDYEAFQHFPILREAWVISLRGLVQTTQTKSNQDIPFFLLPSLGGGHNMKGYESYRFRDRNSLLVQGEWRIMVNRFMDTAFFYDTGTVAEHMEDLNLTGTRDYGFGVRFHSPFSTFFRVDLANSHEGLRLVFAGSAPF
jgi:Omp85 superfamily domain